MAYLLEICVDSYTSALRAAQAGAHRLELCGDLLVGGVSPSPYLVAQVQQAVKIPVNVLLRPRFGDFCFTDEEKQVLLQEVAFCAEAGVNGAVIGALNPDGSLDVPFLRKCIARGKGLEFTLHRCFDVCRDPMEALEQAVELGFSSILTSGQAAAAPGGLELLARLQEKAAGRIHIMAGSGVNPDNIPKIHAATGITHYHFSAKATEPGPMVFRREGVPMGLPMASEYDRQYCNPALVQKTLAALEALPR